MRKNGGAIAAMVIAWLCAAGDVSAQSANEGWRSPDGSFGVQIPAGWQAIDQFVSGPYLLAIGPAPETATRANPELPVCSVEGRSIPTRQMSQDEVNRLVDSMLAPLTAELRPTVVHNSSSDIIDGVRVVSLDVDQQTARGPTRQMQRMFAIPITGGIMHYQIGCGASGSAYRTADMSALRGFVESLVMRGGRQ